MGTAAERLVNVEKQADAWVHPSVTAILKRLRKHRIITFAAATILVLVVAGTVYYWQYARFIISTDDAYAQADSTILASRIFRLRRCRAG
jgi:membrane fusion protein, multidrug efflux system